MKRRALSMKDKLEIMVVQAICPRCGEKLGRLEGLEFDHSTPLALGGADTNGNLRAIHVACHKAKTFGNGATTADGDIGKIAKVKRIREDPSGGEEFRRRLTEKPEPAVEKKPKHKWPSRPFPKRSKT